MANLPMPEGLKTSDLECVMLDVAPIPVSQIMGENYNSDHLFFGDIDELKYAQGAVAETEAHLTLLFGIHPSETYREDVKSIVGDFEYDVPDLVFVSHIGYFPSYIEGQEYYCVVAHLQHKQDILALNRRLTALPHTNQHPEYKPHVTLVYLKRDAPLHLYLDKLSHALNGRAFPVMGVNLGDD